MVPLRNASGAAIFGALAVLPACAAANATSTYASSTIYSFCGQANCSDGARLVAAGGLLLDASGNLFGTANIYGRQGDFGTGSVFELSPP